MPLAEVVRFVSELVDEHQIDYVVVGGVAVSTQTEPRATKDIDLVILIKPALVDPLLDAIEAKGLQISRKAQVAKKLKEGRPAKILWDNRYSFDLRNATFTIDAEALRTAITVHAERYEVHLRVAAPEVLVVYKLTPFDETGRRDIKALMRAYDLNWEYIQEQATILDREYPGKDVMTHFEIVQSWKK